MKSEGFSLKKGVRSQKEYKRKGVSEMKEIGIFKTGEFRDFSIHFDAERQLAMARGPLPNLNEAAKVEAASEEEAMEKLEKELGHGVLAKPARIQ